MSATELLERMEGFLKQAQEYKVQSGDNVWNLIKSRGITMPEMQLANPGKDLAKLRIGETIVIPDGAELERIRQQLNKPSLRGEFNLKQTIQEAATRYGIDPALLQALVFVESSNNSKADSGEAQGLTQLTPYAQRFVGVSDPFDPVQSVYGGAHWLSIAFQEAARLKGGKSKETTRYALMIYHAGGPAVQEWISNGSPARGYGKVQGKTLTYPEKILQLAGR